MHPETRPRQQRERLLSFEIASLSLVPQRGLGSVIERANHSRDVAQWTAFDAALAQRPAGFTFEVDNEEVLSGVQKMAEMQITMGTNSQRVHRYLIDRAIPVEDRILQGQHLFRDRMNRVRQTFQFTAQNAKMKRKMVPQRLIQGALIKRREWFGSEILVLGIGREREVQFANALAHEASRFEKCADSFSRGRGNAPLCLFDQGGAAVVLQRFLGQRANAVKVAAQRIKREIPTVFGIRNKAAQYSKARAVGINPLKLESAHERRHVWKIFLREKLRRLQAWMRAGFEAA